MESPVSRVFLCIDQKVVIQIWRGTRKIRQLVLKAFDFVHSGIESRHRLLVDLKGVLVSEVLFGKQIAVAEP